MTNKCPVCQIEMEGKGGDFFYPQENSCYHWKKEFTKKEIEELYNSD
jgi:hypothetical protein